MTHNKISKITEEHLGSSGKISAAGVLFFFALAVDRCDRLSPSQTGLVYILYLSHHPGMRYIYLQ